MTSNSEHNTYDSLSQEGAASRSNDQVSSSRFVRSRLFYIEIIMMVCGVLLGGVVLLVYLHLSPSSPSARVSPPSSPSDVRQPNTIGTDASAASAVFASPFISSEGANQRGVTPGQDSLNQPLAPSGLSAARAQFNVELRWSGTGGDLTGYRVYRCPTEGPCISVADVTSVGNNRGEYFYRDTSAAINTSTYKVTATDQYGNESSPTSAIVPK